MITKSEQDFRRMESYAASQIGDRFNDIYYIKNCVSFQELAASYLGDPEDLPSGDEYIWFDDGSALSITKRKQGYRNAGALPKSAKTFEYSFVIPTATGHIGFRCSAVWLNGKLYRRSRNALFRLCSPDDSETRRMVMEWMNAGHQRVPAPHTDGSDDA